MARTSGTAGPWRRPLRRSLWLLLPLLLACGGSSTESGATSAAGGGEVGGSGSSQGGAGGAGTSSGGAGGSTSSGAGAADPQGAEHIPDHQALNACAGGAPSPCEHAQVSYGDQYPLGISDLPCLLQAMRDRTPGLYRVTFTDSEPFTDRHLRHTLFITPSGAVERAPYRETITEPVVDGDPEISQSYLPTERCELNPPAYFDNCLSYFGPEPNDYSEEIWDFCLPSMSDQAVPWMSCTPQPPTCQ